MNNKYYEYLNNSSNIYPVAGEENVIYDEYLRQQIVPNNFNDMMDIQNFIGLKPNMQNNINNDCGLYSTYEGFLKGNMFPELYSPYKNYKPQKIKASSEGEALMLQISELGFALKDIDLFLDVHPDNSCMINKYNEILNKKNMLVNEYEKTYGPITLKSKGLNKNPWAWNDVTAPWMRGY